MAEYYTRELELSKFGLKVGLQQRLCKGSIWDVVTMRTVRGQDKVKSFTLKLDKKRPNTKNEVDKALQLVLDMFCAPEGAGYDYRSSDRRRRNGRRVRK